MQNIKLNLLTQCQVILSNKEDLLLKQMAELSEALLSEQKSSAGDKHETARAMLQLEQEQLSKQLSEIQTLIKDLNGINYLAPTTKVISGSLVKTNQGYFIVGVAIGKIKQNNIEAFIISAQSPIGKFLMNKSVKDAFDFNGKKYVIEEID
jgi:transcription elongation GreA/GreB family factor